MFAAVARVRQRTDQRRESAQQLPYAFDDQLLPPLHYREQSVGSPTLPVSKPKPLAPHAGARRYTQAGAGCNGKANTAERAVIDGVMGLRFDPRTQHALVEAARALQVLHDEAHVMQSLPAEPARCQLPAVHAASVDLRVPLTLPRCLFLHGW
jgi:hypothetical protein